MKNIVLVRETRRKARYGKSPFFWWKFPGGKVKEGETPLEGAWREKTEETGEHATTVDDLVEIAVIDRGTHKLTVFMVMIDPGNLAKHGSEGEEIKLVPLDELEEMKDLMMSHRDMVRQIPANWSGTK